MERIKNPRINTEYHNRNSLRQQKNCLESSSIVLRKFHRSARIARCIKHRQKHYLAALLYNSPHYKSLNQITTYFYQCYKKKRKEKKNKEGKEIPRTTNKRLAASIRLRSLGFNGSRITISSTWLKYFLQAHRLVTGVLVIRRLNCPGETDLNCI